MLGANPAFRLQHRHGAADRALVEVIPTRKLRLAGQRLARRVDASPDLLAQQLGNLLVASAGGFQAAHGLTFRHMCTPNHGSRSRNGAPMTCQDTKLGRTYDISLDAYAISSVP